MADRMQGDIGFIEDIVGLFTAGDRKCMELMLLLDSWSDVRAAAREILRRLGLDQGVSAHMPVGRTWPQADIDRFAKWIDEGTPKVRGERYAAYFRDLDAVTQYFDVYGRPPADNLKPAYDKYFGRNDEPGRRKALNIWRNYAIIPDDDPTKATERQALEQELAQPDVASAVKTVDAAMLDNVRKYWFFAGALDREVMLEAFLRFGADRLPEDNDRLTRIQNLNDPNDPRLNTALLHRMDGQIMWMNWMGHVECAATVFGPTHADHGLRTVFFSALCLGYSADAVFRKRGQTHPEYYQPDGEDRMWRKSVLIANDFDKARAEAHELARLRQTMPMAVLAADVPSVRS
jgi:hypothetical protein